jgi:hypothetical protein
MALVDDNLLDLVFLALDHGIGSISDASGETLIPFLISQDGSGRQLKRFVADTFEESVGMARADAARLPQQTELVALAFDGFITVEGTRWDAVIVQAQRRGNPRCATFAQRYKRDGSRIEAVGNPASLGDGEPLF